MSFFRISSVTRWLPVVIGCAVLETAQPMNGAPAESTAPRSGDTIIYPKGSPEQTEAAADSGSGNKSLIVALALLLGAGGAWMLIQRRQATGASLGRGSRKLMIDETRPLGNRQYLVVANYDGKKFLLGVTPGQIQMLTPLGDQDGETQS